MTTTEQKRKELVDDITMRQEELKRKAYFAWRDKKLDKDLFESMVHDINEHKEVEIGKVKKLSRRQVEYHYKKLLARRLKLKMVGSGINTEAYKIIRYYLENRED